MGLEYPPPATAEGGNTFTGNNTYSGNNVHTAAGTEEFRGNSLRIQDAGADHVAVINVADLAANRTLTIPDPGAAAGFVLTVGTQTISGARTFTGGVTLTTAGLTLTDVNVVLSATTGTKIGTATTQKLGFFNATPVAQPGAYTQTYATADKTHANPTATALTDNTGGTANTTLQALADGTTYANDVAAIRNNFADLAASNNALIADLADVKQLVNSIIDDLQSLGLVG